ASTTPHAPGHGTRSLKRLHTTGRNHTTEAARCRGRRGVNLGHSAHLTQRRRHHPSRAEPAAGGGANRGSAARRESDPPVPDTTSRRTPPVRPRTAKPQVTRWGRLAPTVRNRRTWESQPDRNQPWQDRPTATAGGQRAPDHHVQPTQRGPPCPSPQFAPLRRSAAPTGKARLMTAAPETTAAMNPRLLTLDQAAGYLNVPERWLSDAVRG